MKKYLAILIVFVCSTGAYAQSISFNELTSFTNRTNIALRIFISPTGEPGDYQEAAVIPPGNSASFKATRSRLTSGVERRIAGEKWYAERVSDGFRVYESRVSLLDGRTFGVSQKDIDLAIQSCRNTRTRFRGPSSPAPIARGSTSATSPMSSTPGCAAKDRSDRHGPHGR